MDKYIKEILNTSPITTVYHFLGYVMAARRDTHCHTLLRMLRRWEPKEQ